MCKCDPNIRAPFCGNGDCKWPDNEDMVNEIRNMQALALILEGVKELVGVVDQLTDRVTALEIKTRGTK